MDQLLNDEMLLIEEMDQLTINIKTETPDDDTQVNESIKDFTIVVYIDSTEQEMFGTQFLANREHEVR